MTICDDLSVPRPPHPPACSVPWLATGWPGLAALASRPTLVSLVVILVVVIVVHGVLLLVVLLVCCLWT